MGIFKAYDIRGIVPKDLNEHLAEKIGRAAVVVLKAKSMVVTRDVRITGEQISAAFIRGVLAAGCDVVDTGAGTTPMSYFAVGSMGLDAACMVTASHNPPEYNGFKFSGAGGSPVSFETGLGQMEALVKSGNLPTAAKAGSLVRKDIRAEYRAHLLKFARNLKPKKIAVDATNGAAALYFKYMVEGLPIDLVPLFFEVDGRFPNHEPNPLKAENMRWLQDAVRKHKCDFGVAFDGDGDRAMFTDEAGEIVPPDLMTALFAPWLLRGEPVGSAVAYDLRSSWAVPEEIEAAGGAPVETRVGHSFIKGVLRDKNAVYGGELSGHYYFRDNYCCDSGEIAFFILWSLLSDAARPLGELMKPLKRFHASGEINFEVEEKDAALERLAKSFADGHIYYLDGISVKYPDWHFNVRKSNTEPLLRLTLEAKSAEGLRNNLARVKAVIEND
ncbi:MAG TPA: phosphomannomutase/phosphoglucomutase [Planctomycetota bacterium]|nr:phosphomannomutase/phosphoglucomutase [Planctomycetota bacterium]